MIDIQNHLKEFPNAVMTEVNGRVYGHWIIGNSYKSPKPYYGTYPPSYLDRVFSLIHDHGPVLHLFSGAQTEGGTTFDINASLNPDICGDAEKLSEYLPPDSVGLCLADPPYSAIEAKHYGTKNPVTYKVFRELYKVIEKGGLVVWLCTRIPMWRKEEWFLRGLIGLFVGTNKVYRAVVILERR